MDTQEHSEDWYRENLSEQEYRVLREAGTEAPFVGKYTDTETEGIYSCRACGSELFRSTEKFHSGCGWPSFFASADSAAVREIVDSSLGMTRTEIRCTNCDSPHDPSEGMCVRLALIAHYGEPPSEAFRLCCSTCIDMLSLEQPPQAIVLCDTCSLPSVAGNFIDQSPFGRSSVHDFICRQCCLNEQALMRQYLIDDLEVQKDVTIYTCGTCRTDLRSELSH